MKPKSVFFISFSLELKRLLDMLLRPWYNSLKADLVQFHDQNAWLIDVYETQKTLLEQWTEPDSAFFKDHLFEVKAFWKKYSFTSSREIDQGQFDDQGD